MRKLILIFITTCFILFIYTFIEPYIITVKRYMVENNDLKDLKIVFLSDFHHSEINSIGKIKRIVEQTNMLKPDIIILGGDYVESNEYVDAIFHELKNLKANIGIYGVTGNHDYVNSTKIKNLIKENFILLDNNYIEIEYENKILKLVGVSDIWFEEPILDYDLKETDHVIMVSHNPDIVERIDKNLYDLILSGHTHGGQITFFGLFAPYVPSHYGYRTGKIDNLIISNGLGSIFLPMRFFAVPQIVEINFI